MEFITATEFGFGLLVIFVAVAIFNLTYKLQEYIWHERGEIPERENENSNISEDCIVFDLNSEKEIIAYFDFQYMDFIDTNGNRITFSYYKWRYKNLNF